MRHIDRFARKQPWVREKGPTGETLCACGCGRPIGPRRQSSHSAECVKVWRSHSDVNHIRRKVERRDRGVCAICGADTEALKAEWGRALIAWHAEETKGYSKQYRDQWHANLNWTTVLRQGDRQKMPKPPVGFPAQERRWWEADHIVPVAEGGGGCDYNGYRTLCIPCHRAETKLLAGRLAAARKKQVATLELDLR